MLGFMGSICEWFWRRGGDPRFLQRFASCGVSKVTCTLHMEFLCELDFEFGFRSPGDSSDVSLLVLKRDTIFRHRVLSFADRMGFV